MAEVSAVRNWEALLPDVLGLIFSKLSLQQVLAVISLVCKSWRSSVMGPYLFQVIDIEEWSQDQGPENITRMLQMLITRSCGSVQKLCVSGIPSDDTFTFIANNAKSLQVLQCPKSAISNPVVEQFAGMLSKLTFLDLSYCLNLGAAALEALGKNCRSLTKLRRIMHPLDAVNKDSQDDEALAIAATMPNLKKLEIAYLSVGTESVVEIILKCKMLEFLDVRGCYSVKPKEIRNFRELMVVGPGPLDYCERSGWDATSSNSSSSGYLAWDFVAGDDLDDLFDVNVSDEEDEESVGEVEVEVFFYDGFDADDAGHDWPQGP